MFERPLIVLRSAFSEVRASARYRAGAARVVTVGLLVAALGQAGGVAAAATAPATASVRARQPHALTKDRTAVSLAFLSRTGAVATDLRHSVVPGTVSVFAAVAYAYNAEGQQIVGPLVNPISLSFVGSALTLLAPASGIMTVSPAEIAVKYGGSTSPAIWGLSEVRGGSTPVPFDMLQTGLNGYGNPGRNASVCTAASLPQAAGYPGGTTFQADTQGCLTVAPFIVTAGGAQGPNLTQNLDVAGQLGAGAVAGSPLKVQEGTDLPLSFFEARTGSGYEPEVAQTDFSFLPTMYDRGKCTPQFGAPSSAGAMKYWIAHGYFFASPAIWYWNYGDPNCSLDGQNWFPPSGLSDVLEVGPGGAALPYGFAIHGDSSFGRPSVETVVWLTDGRVYRYLWVTVTK